MTLNTGRTDMEYTYHYASPISGITLASDGKSLIGLWFDGQKYFADALTMEKADVSSRMNITTQMYRNGFPAILSPLRLDKHGIFRMDFGNTEQKIRRCPSAHDCILFTIQDFKPRRTHRQLPSCIQ